MTNIDYPPLLPRGGLRGVAHSLIVLHPHERDAAYAFRLAFPSCHLPHQRRTVQAQRPRRVALAHPRSGAVIRFGIAVLDWHNHPYRLECFNVRMTLEYLPTTSGICPILSSPRTELFMAASQNPIPTTLGESIKRARNGRRLSQSALAEALGITRNTVIDWENGKRQPVDGNLEAVRSFFGADFIEPVDPPRVASLDFYRGRVVQIASHLRAVLAEQDELARVMARAVETQAKARPSAEATLSEKSKKAAMQPAAKRAHLRLSTGESRHRETD